MDWFMTKAMTQFFSDHPPKAFRPCAYYDEHLDCIRVQTRDCSFIEIRVNTLFTIYQANHLERVEYIGFSIKGIRYAFEKTELSKEKERPFILAEIIDVIIKAYPDLFSDLILREFAGTLSLEVEGLPYQEAA
jgi:hypothetical protein